MQKKRCNTLVKTKIMKNNKSITINKTALLAITLAFGISVSAQNTGTPETGGKYTVDKAICGNHTNTDIYNCFTILAGRNATADGSVLLAHNEDDGGEQMLNMYVVPADKSKKRAKYIWGEFPGMETADLFMNQYGVAIVSDQCISREEKGELSEGGILYNLRLTVAREATTAKEAVRIMGRLVEKYGYRTSGRSYMVADNKEGWVFSAVEGKHWVAAKVPDNAVMIIPNNYVIDNINLSDTINFAGSKDIIQYATERGWYNKQRDGAFSFKKAYGDPAAYRSKRNVIRHLSAIQYFTGKPYHDDPDTFEFTVVPARKVTLQDMMNVLRSHGENTKYAMQLKKEDGSHPDCICYKTTVLSAIFQLRSNMPVEIGSVMWMTPCHPCVSAYIPWYLGMTEAPENFSRYNNAEEAIQKHMQDTKEMRSNWPGHIFWKYIDSFEKINADYAGNIFETRSANADFQEKIFKEQEGFEKKAAKIAGDKTKLGEMLNNYTSKLYKSYIKLYKL